ncbi:MAG: glycosyltransferase family 2 protein [Patescibacteria group bacterium]|nr:glycosyltransferase family 2 protein [Patescibacteria group bacterium]
MDNFFIVIINYKTPALLRQCLDSILKNNPGMERRILVIDNFSEDESFAMMQKDFPEIKVLASQYNSGFGTAINWGINNAPNTAKYLVFLNPDIIMRGNALEKMLEFMEKRPEVALIGPKLLNPDLSVQSSCRRFITPKLILYRRTFLGRFGFAKKALQKFLMEDINHKKIQEVDWIFGACMMVRLAAIRDVGLMDERYFLYFEDMDWCRRFWEKGWKVYYYPEAEMIHYHRRDSAVESGFSALFNRAARIHIRSAVKYFIKYFGVPKPREERLENNFSRARTLSRQVSR